MALVSGANIVGVREGFRFLPGGGSVRTTIVTYMVGNDGPFTLEAAPPADTAEAIQAAINDKAAQIAALRASE